MPIEIRRHISEVEEKREKQANEENVATLPADEEEKEGEHRDRSFSIGNSDTSTNPTCTNSPYLMPEEINLF